jgi:hypothetical protein
MKLADEIDLPFKMDVALLSNFEDHPLWMTVVRVTF